MTFNNEIVAGNVLVREAIQSENYAPGSAGWKIAADGNAEFNDVTVRGELIAGNSSDYVKVTPSPVPAIEWMSGSLNILDPARIGYAALADDTWEIEGPRYSSTAPSVISFSDGSLYLTGNSDLTLEATTGTVAVRGGVARIGGNFSYAEFSGNDETFVTYGTDRGKGVRDYVAVTATTALSAAETIGITSNAVDFEVGRAYRLTFHYGGSGNTANDGIGFRMRRTNLLGTSLFDSLRTHTLPAAGAILGQETSQIVFNNTGALLNTVIVGTVYRAAGAGNVQWFGNAANPTWLLIEDIGVVADYPGAKAL